MFRASLDNQWNIRFTRAPTPFLSFIGLGAPGNVPEVRGCGVCVRGGGHNSIKKAGEKALLPVTYHLFRVDGPPQRSPRPPPRDGPASHGLRPVLCGRQARSLSWVEVYVLSASQAISRAECRPVWPPGDGCVTCSAFVWRGQRSIQEIQIIIYNYRALSPAMNMYIQS